jgi:hypothetical protein
MPKTIREQIIQAVVTRLAVVRRSNGYNTNCGRRVKRCRKSLDPDDLPAFVVWPQPEEAERKYGFSQCTMPMRIEALQKHGKKNHSKAAEAALGDMIRAMTAPEEIGKVTNGLADDVVYILGGPEDYPEDDDTVTGCAAMFTIKYKTLAGDPYTQSTP